MMERKTDLVLQLQKQKWMEQLMKKKEEEEEEEEEDGDVSSVPVDNLQKQMNNKEELE